MDNLLLSYTEDLQKAERTPRRYAGRGIGLAVLLTTATLSLNACNSDDSSSEIVTDSSSLVTTTSIDANKVDIPSSSSFAVETTEATTTDVTPTTESVPTTMNLEEQFLNLELPDYEIGERMGYIAIDGIVLTQLFQADDGLSTENPFVDYVVEGAAAWGGELKPGNGINNTMVIGGHRTAESAPFNKLQEVKKGDELLVVFQTGDSYSATDVATLKYVTQMDAPVQITQYDVDLVTEQLDAPSVRLFTCNSLDYRLIMDFELVSVENTIDN
jgi:LPXTG-site transpeptidase (sortase) family protein